MKNEKPELPEIDELVEVVERGFDKTTFMELYNTVSSWLISEFTNNDFLVGVALPAAGAYLLYASRSLFKGFFITLKYLATSTYTVTSNNTHFAAISRYINEKVVIKSLQRYYNISSDIDNNEDIYWSEKNTLKKTVIPEIGYGTSFGFIGWMPVIVHRELETNTVSEKYKETMTIYSLGRGRWLTKKLVEEINRNISQVDENTLMVRIIEEYDDYWLVPPKPARSLDSVFVPRNIKERLVNEIERFLSSERRYAELGIPYHLGILLHGKPGTGKTSLAHALATKFGKNILYLGRNGLLKMVKRQVNVKDYIVLLEDIDVSGEEVEKRQTETEVIEELDGIPLFVPKSSPGKPTMSEILNILDGMHTPHGMILIATTNHKEALDDAVIRPGRFDIVLELNDLEWTEWVEMCRFFGRTSPVSKDEYEPINPAKARYLLVYASDEGIRKEIVG